MCNTLPVVCWGGQDYFLHNLLSASTSDYFVRQEQTSAEGFIAKRTGLLLRRLTMGVADAGPRRGFESLRFRHRMALITDRAGQSYLAIRN